MNKLFTVLVLSLSVLFFSCEKEKSFELDDTPAQGSLQEDGGGLCLPKTVNGTYVATTALVPSTNTITVDVNVASAGTYTIYTDTINGYHFRGTGNFTANGMQTVTLNGSGTPLVQGNNVFTVFFDSTECDITVQVLPAGAGGPAVFALAGAGGACTTPVIAGNYVIGTALGSSNTVTLSVNVTTVGSYNVTTTAVNGMTFSTGAGVFTATGAQTIVLTGSGTPTGTPGAVTIPVTAGTSTCSFQITTTNAAAFTWQFMVGTTTYQGVNDSISYDVTALPPPFIIVDHYGTNAATDDYNLAFLDIAGGVTANETYNSNVDLQTTLANAGYFYYFGGGLELEASDPSITPGVNIVIKVISHNTSTKTITGTFSGTAHDYTSNTTKTVSNGSFTIVYP